MIEKILLDYLGTKLTVPVLMEVPEDDVTSFVVLQKTGSAKTDHIPSATIAAQSYGSSKYEAAQLNETVKSAIEGAIELNEISKVELNSDYDFTDTATKRYRYQALYVITYLA